MNEPRLTRIMIGIGCSSLVPTARMSPSSGGWTVGPGWGAGWPRRPTPRLSRSGGLPYQVEAKDAILVHLGAVEILGVHEAVGGVDVREERQVPRRRLERHLVELGPLG